MAKLALKTLVVIAAGLVSAAAAASPAEDQRIVARLDVEFQAAVKVNDADAMARIFHNDMILVLGNGTAQTREQLLQEARAQVIRYEEQDEDPGTQRVRVWGDTAVVTALLWVKGVHKDSGASFDRHLWFSDTYVRTPAGWRYAFGQASLALPTR
jgi:ketosteroid isomerase-like protein